MRKFKVDGMKVEHKMIRLPKQERTTTKKNVTRFAFYNGSEQLAREYLGELAKVFTFKMEGTAVVAEASF